MFFYGRCIGLFDEIAELFVLCLRKMCQAGASVEEMIDQTVTAVTVNYQVTVKVRFFGFDGIMRRDWRFGFAACRLLRGGEATTFALEIAQDLVIAFFAACHDTQQVMHTTAHIPLKQRAAALWVDIQVLAVAIYQQFFLAVAIKVGELETLPGSCSPVECVGGVFGLDEVMVDGGAHVAGINSTK